MPLPFLAVLGLEAAFFLLYWRVVLLLPSARAVEVAHYVMLGAEIIFHTTMVYFLGGIGWLGPFAYVIGMIFANAFLDAKRGFVYTAAAASAFASLALLDAGGIIPHYAYLDSQGYRDDRYVFTTVVGGVGVFATIYAWMNWVGRQLRIERDTAMGSQQELLQAQTWIRNQNAELELRVGERTAELERTNAALRLSEALARATIESTADGILVVDRAGKVSYANTRFAALWRIPDVIVQTRDDEQMLASYLISSSTRKHSSRKCESYTPVIEKISTHCSSRTGESLNAIRVRSSPVPRSRAASGASVTPPSAAERKRSCASRRAETR